MHVAGSEENFKYFIALVLKVIDEKYIQSVFRLFVISLLTFSYFSPIISLFGAGAAPFFTAPAPAPAPSKLFRRLRLRLRLQPKCVGSGGSGSGSGSGSASLLKTLNSPPLTISQRNISAHLGWSRSARQLITRSQLTRHSLNGSRRGSREPGAGSRDSVIYQLPVQC